jgi:MoaA/NifB/PqqE/SkfB family radical SAM enzyme
MPGTKLNYNMFSSSPKIDPNWNTETKPLCKRAKLDTGTFCNLKCSFCYYKDQLDKQTSLETILKRLEYIKGYDLITEIELSGGESSVHPEWFQLLNECSKYYNHISTLSNGSKFNNLEFLLDSKKAGLKEILFSVHGYGDTHDQITGRNKSFINIDKAINNSLNNGIITRINCTICNENYKDISTKFTEYILELIMFGIKQVNFIFLNFWDDAKSKNKDFIDYNELVKDTLKAIDIIKEDYPDFDIRLRYVPYCFIPEKYHSIVYGQFGHVFDTTDWNKEIYNHLVFSDPDIKYTYNESLKLGWQAAKQNRLHSYFKTKECYKCSKFLECDGIENEIRFKQEIKKI